jgi:site-specific DNA-cytosine methylase
MNTIELFSGTKSFSRVAASLGHRTLTIDNNPDLSPDHAIDILALRDTEYKLKHAEVLWASPPCTAFSCASMGHHWGGGRRAYIPKTEEAKLGMELALKTLSIIKGSKPTWWFIENPQGMLKKMPFMQEIGIMHTVWYCHYGDTRAKPTNIWTNAEWWKPMMRCHNRRKSHPDTCCCHDHEAAPRGAKTGTQGIDGARLRGVIPPPPLFLEIFSQMPEKPKLFD